MKTNCSMDTHSSEISEYEVKIKNLTSLWKNIKRYLQRMTFTHTAANSSARMNDRK